MIYSGLLRQFNDLVHGFSTRAEGNLSLKVSELDHLQSKVLRMSAIEKRLAYFKELGIDQEDVVLSRQVHATVVEEVRHQHRGQAHENGSPFESADALITVEPNLFLTVFAADCLPIFIIDPIQRYVATVHAGWRGLAGNIIEKTIVRLVERGSSPADLYVWVGPHVKSCHYLLVPESESFKEKIAAFPLEGPDVVRRDDNFFLDLTGVAVRQLKEAGIIDPHVEISGDCTACHPDRYYSYSASKAKVEGIMLGVLGWRKGENA